MVDISFIIPMYNASRFIDACLSSIYDQDLCDDRFEVIVIDDGSTDDGKEIIHDHFPRVKYYYQNNRGLSASRNRGIELASGRYLCFIDADDQLVRKRIKLCIDTAISLNVDVLTYGIVVCKESQVGKLDFQYNTKVSNVITGVEYLSYNFNNGAWQYLIKRDFLSDLRFIEGRFAEDGMFTMELFMKCHSMVRVEQPCYYYIQREGSITKSQDESHLRKMISDYLFAYNYLQDLISKNTAILTCDALLNCRERSESYLFFLLVRFMRCPFATGYIKSVITELKENKIYPINRLNPVNYPGLRFTISTIIVNKPTLLLTFNLFYSIIIIPSRKLRLLFRRSMKIN